MRLDKSVSHGFGLSRTRAGAVIRSKRVTVDGVVVRDPGMAVPEGADVRLDGEAVVAVPRLAAFHKPEGVHSTVADPQGRPCLAGVARELLAMGLHPVGRLDHDTSGLLLFSSDGALTQWLLHPRRGVPRTYVATTDPAPDAALPATLAAGVSTAEGTFAASNVEINGNAVTLTVAEGKHRMVRRMLHNAGHSVVTLHRVAYGPVSLGTLAEGAWHPIADDVVATLGFPLLPQDE